MKRIAFTQVENEDFREFILYLHPALAAWLPQSDKHTHCSIHRYLTNYSIGATIHSWIMSEFELREAQVKQLLDNAPGQIHISVDGWVSPNNIALLGIVAYFFNEVDQVQTLPIGLSRFTGSHSAENVASIASRVLYWYGIATKTGYYVLDNIAVNDCVVAILLEERYTPDFPNRV